MKRVTIEVDARWVKIVHSPLYWTVAILQGVSITFAPLFLYWSGKGWFLNRWEWLIVPSCFAVILFVGFFYRLLGSVVIGELRKKKFAA